MKRLLLLLPLALSACVIYPERHIRRTPAREPVSATKVCAFRAADVPDDQVLDKIGRNGINREQNADDIVMMKKNGVSEQVIAAMINAPVLPPTPEHTEEIVYEDYPGYYDNGSSFWLGAALGYWLRPWGHYRCR